MCDKQTYIDIIDLEHLNFIGDMHTTINKQEETIA